MATIKRTKRGKRIAKVFRSGNSQAVRLPKDFQLEVKEVEIIKHNKDIILRPLSKNLSEAYELFAQMPDDFFEEGRKDSLPQC